MLTHCFTSIYDMRKFAEEKLEYPIERLTFFGWTQSFSSTAGPGGGIGGQAITPFDVVAFLNELNGDAVMFCSNVWKIKRGIRPSEKLMW